MGREQLQMQGRRMNILFLHGLEGKPTGTKAKFLESLGHNVIAPTLPKNDLFHSREIAAAALEDHEIDVIVGSSRGGAIACGLDTSITRILIAPAFRAFGIEPTVPPMSELYILHCKDDKLVPYDFSLELWADFPRNITLHDVGENHRMSDPKALDLLGRMIKIRVEEK